MNLKREQKDALRDQAVALWDAAEIQGSAIGELGDGEMLSSMDRPEGSDATSRLRAEVEDLKAQLESSAESFVNSRLQLAQDNLALQTKLELQTPDDVQEELEWMGKLKRLQRF